MQDTLPEGTARATQLAGGITFSRRICEQKRGGIGRVSVRRRRRTTDDDGRLRVATPRSHFGSYYNIRGDL
jgi:hypothetical protein